MNNEEQTKNKEQDNHKDAFTKKGCSHQKNEVHKDRHQDINGTKLYIMVSP